MQMSDMLLQMTLMNTWQTLQATVTSGQDPVSGSANQQTTFQDLLDQRRSELSNSVEKDAESSPTDSDSQPVEQPQDGKELAATESDLTVLATGQVLMTSLVVPMEEVAGQPDGSASAAVQLVTAVDSAPQQNAMPLAGMPVQQELQQPAQAPVVDTAVAADPQAAVSQQAAEVVLPSGEADTAEAFSQQLAQPDAGQEPKSQLTEQAEVQSWHTPLFRDVEATPVRVGDAPVDMTAPAQDVEKTLSQSLKGAVEQGDQFLQIRLSPANLGNVVAEFTRSPEGALHIVLHAETEQAAKLLSNHASSLSLMLQDSTHTEVRVEVPQPQQEQTAWQQDQNGGQQQRQQQQQQQQQPRRETESFLHQLRLGLVQMETQAV